jgi:protein-S-isoprenylcysteine O-methyltransferase Ste14
LGGLWLIARSVSRIDALELAGIRSAARSETLQIAGPYRWVRHPLYLGWILLVFGTAHMTGDRLAFAVISTAYLLIAIPWEERSLRQAFGPAYADYQRAVHWRVVPFVY